LLKDYFPRQGRRNFEVKTVHKPSMLFKEKQQYEQWERERNNKHRDMERTLEQESSQHWS